MNKDDTLAAIKAINELEERMANLASICGSHKLLITATACWISLGIAVQALVQLASIDGVDVEKDLQPEMPKPTSLVIRAEDMITATRLVASRALDMIEGARQLNTAKESLIIQ